MHEERLRTLKVLRRVKEGDLDKVQALMAECTASEAALSRQIAEAQAEIISQRDTALPSDFGDDAILLQQSFREWLPGALAGIGDLEKNLEEAQRRSEEVRLELFSANSALEVTDDLIRRLEEEDRSDRERKEQNELDDISRSQFILRRKIRKKKTDIISR